MSGHTRIESINSYDPGQSVSKRMNMAESLMLKHPEEKTKAAIERDFRPMIESQNSDNAEHEFRPMIENQMSDETVLQEYSYDLNQINQVICIPFTQDSCQNEIQPSQSLVQYQQTTEIRSEYNGSSNNAKELEIIKFQANKLAEMSEQMCKMNEFLMNLVNKDK